MARFVGPVGRVCSGPALSASASACAADSFYWVGESGAPGCRCVVGSAEGALRGGPWWTGRLVRGVEAGPQVLAWWRGLGREKLWRRSLLFRPMGADRERMQRWEGCMRSGLRLDWDWEQKGRGARRRVGRGQASGCGRLMRGLERAGGGERTGSRGAKTLTGAGRAGAASGPRGCRGWERGGG